MKKPIIKKNKKSPQTNKKNGPSYDQLKVFEGQYYKGMKVGRRHHWHYAKGVWKEQKLTPDLWKFHYQVKKKRAGKAPEGSGVPVGTEYQWAILAKQVVRKLDANTYETEMDGLKFKVAYKKADKNSWSVGTKGQRDRLIQFLQQTIDFLKKEDLAKPTPSKKLTKKKNGS